MPDLKTRQDYLALVEKKRGKAAADQLKADVGRERTTRRSA